MKHLSRLLVLSMLVLMLSMVMTTTAQEEDGDFTTGEGDPIIAPNLGTDIATLNPILSSDGSSAAIIGRILPDLIEVNPDTLDLDVNAPGSLAESIEISDDGLVYTITLRQDWGWSDGTPITAADYKYGFDAIASGETNTSLSYVLDDVANVEVLDDFTLEVTVNSPSCGAINNIAVIPFVPAHIYTEWFPEFADMNESPRNLGVQPATAGVWEFRNFRPGEQVTLIASENYPDPLLGAVVPEGFIFRNVANTQLQVEELLAGNLTTTGVPGDRQDEFRDLAEEGVVQISETELGNLRFIAVNSADPSNPQPGLDEDGNPIDQGFHPILGDLRVRQALMHARDFDELNASVLAGSGIEVASHWLPDAWTYNPDLPFYEFDLELAGQLLDEAGFTDEDGDGIRECNGCLYAEAGTPLALELLTNAGNDDNEAIGVLLQDQWGRVGFDIDFQAIDFNILVDTLLGQEYDMVMIFWGFAFPSEPSNSIRSTFGPTNDLPGAGFNTTSYNNPRVTELIDLANDPTQTNGCDQETRRPLYDEAYQILRDEVPWIWFNSSIVMRAAQPGVENWDPRPGIGGFWNENSWLIGFETQE